MVLMHIILMVSFTWSAVTVIIQLSTIATITAGVVLVVVHVITLSA